MAESFLKRSLPRGIYGRAALILLVPIITIQLVVSIVFLQRHYEDVTRQMTATVIRDVRLVQADPGLGAPLGILRQGAVPLLDARLWYDFSGRIVMQELRGAFPDLGFVDLSSNTKEVRFGLNVDSTAWVVERRRVSAANPHQFLVLVIFTTIVMTVVAILFLRNQVRPIRRLARAAEAFGRGQSLPYRPTGATEVRAAGRAFLDMRARIERQIEQRTLLLSGVSHDLRTPLTRMRLELSMMEGEGVAGLRQDVAEMQQMIDAFLDFARENAGEVPQLVDPVLLAEQVTQDFARIGGPIETHWPEPGKTVALRTVGVRRAVGNLLKNARRYGQRIRFSVVFGPKSVTFVIEDDGPGIPQAQREIATRPFARLDAARGEAEGSVGLGLAIVTDVVRAHGGRLELGISAELGGLRAAMIFPR